MSFRQIMYSPTITPPLATGQRLRLAAMNTQWSMGDGRIDSKKDMVVLGKKEGYDGIYTGGMTACMAVTIVERDSKGNINHLLMIHFGGGINTDCLDALMNVLTERKLEKGGYREFIITAGSDYRDVNHFRSSLEIHIEPSDIDAYLNQEHHAELRFHGGCKYVHVPGRAGSACVTFDGYAGPLYRNMSWESSRRDKANDDFIVPVPALPAERDEFEKIEKYFNYNTQIKNVKNAIEGSRCDDSVRAQLYFYTREFIFNTQFKEIQSEDKKQGYKEALENYKNKVEKLPLSTKKEKIIMAVTCPIGIGLFTTLPYLFYQRRRREKVLTELQKVLPEIEVKKYLTK